MRLTDAGVRALKPRGERYEVWEGGHTGFGVRVSPRGTKTFVLMYRFRGRARRLTLGCYPAIGLADARLAAAAARARLDKGEDPAAEAVEQRREERQTPDVESLTNRYLAEWAKVRKRTWREDERLLRKDVVPAWRGRRACDVTRRDVKTLVAGIASRGAPIAANRTLAVVRKMYAWALAEEVAGIVVNPAVGVAPPATERQRDRVLSADEIKALWHGLDGGGMRPALCLALRFALVTLQRRGEVAGMGWGEVDEAAAMWTIPAHRAKNGIAHRVPLPPLAMHLLVEARRLTRPKHLTEPSLFVFPSPRGPAAITAAALSHALRRRTAALGLNDITPHDLRRSGASHMTSAGVSRLVVGKILNHIEPGVTAVYDRHGYDGEKRQALETWEARLRAVAELPPPSSDYSVSACPTP